MPKKLPIKMPKKLPVAIGQQGVGTASQPTQHPMMYGMCESLDVELELYVGQIVRSRSGSMAFRLIAESSHGLWRALRLLNISTRDGAVTGDIVLVYADDVVPVTHDWVESASTQLQSLREFFRRVGDG